MGMPFTEAEQVIMKDRPDCKVIHVKPVFVHGDGHF